MNSIVIFLSVFFIQIYSDENTFDCTGQKDDSFHPMLNDCRFYWHCIFVDTVYMRAVKRVCPAGTKFDIRVNECEWANSVNCVPTKPQTTTTTPLPSTEPEKLTTIKLHTTKFQRGGHRDNLTVNILISNERKIRRFPIYSTYGILIYCNEIRRHQLRHLIFRPMTTTTTIILNSSSKIFHYDILSLTIFLIFTKISD